MPPNALQVLSQSLLTHSQKQETLAKQGLGFWIQVLPANQRKY
jgi:hypothetical protein